MQDIKVFTGRENMNNEQLNKTCSEVSCTVNYTIIGNRWRIWVKSDAGEKSFGMKETNKFQDKSQWSHTVNS